MEEFKEQRGRLLEERWVVEERQPLSPGLLTCTVLGGSGLSWWPTSSLVLGDTGLTESSRAICNHTAACSLQLSGWKARLKLLEESHWKA